MHTNYLGYRLHIMKIDAVPFKKTTQNEMFRFELNRVEQNI